VLCGAEIETDGNYKDRGTEMSGHLLGEIRLLNKWLRELAPKDWEKYPFWREVINHILEFERNQPLKPMAIPSQTLDLCRNCGGIADPGVFDEKYGILCEKCAESGR
jgi:hypothetical protein